MLICRWNNTSTRVFDTLDPIINHYLHFFWLKLKPPFWLYEPLSPHIVWTSPSPTMSWNPYSNLPVDTPQPGACGYAERQAQHWGCAQGAVGDGACRGAPQGPSGDGFRWISPGDGAKTWWFSPYFEGTKHPFTSYWLGYLGPIGYQDFDHHEEIMGISWGFTKHSGDVMRI